MRRSEFIGVERAPFQAFARSTFWPFRTRLRSLDVTLDFANVRRAMRESCPARPGVYGMVDPRGQLIYVGVSSVLRKRLITYFQGGETVRKERAIAAHAARLVWEVVGHPLVAQLRELELIRAHQPRFNVQGRRRARPLGYLYVSVEAAPRIRIGRRVPKAARHFWGPLRIGWQIREAVEKVNRLFKLCDCPSSTPMHFADQRRLFDLDLRLECLRGEIGTCLGPCAGQCTRRQYGSQIRKARRFLDGLEHETLATLEEQLREAVERLQFERAAQLRDTLGHLQLLADRLQLLREPPLPEQFIYPVSAGRHVAWLLVRDGEVRAAVRQPADRPAIAKCRKLFDEVFRVPSTEEAERDRPAAAIVSMWFRANSTERQRIFLPEDCGFR